MHETFDIQWHSATDGLRLRTARWPVNDAPAGPALMCTGRNESLERYEEMARGFAQRGFAPWCFDWRGQGGSGRETRSPDRGHVKSFESYLQDLRVILDGPLKGEAPVVLAHSMGGHLSLRFAHDNPAAFRALILSAPMIEIETGPLPASLVGWVARTGSRLAGAEAYIPGHRNLLERSKRFEGNVLTHDRSRFERNHALLETHPELVTGGATFGWLAEAIRSMGVAQGAGYAEAITTPTLFLSAGADTVVRIAAQRRYAERMPTGQQVVIQGAKHELLQETDARLRKVWGAIDEFLHATGIAYATDEAVSR